MTRSHPLDDYAAASGRFEPVWTIEIDWASQAHYNPNSDNPHRWWNNGRGLPDRIEE